MTTKAEFTTYLHKTFRKNVYEARHINNGYKRAEVVSTELGKFQAEFEKVAEFKNRDFIKWIQNNNFKVKYKNKAEVRTISIYDYALKYMATRKGQHCDMFNNDFYNLDNSNNHTFMDGDKKFTQTYFKGSDGADVSIFDNGINASGSALGVLQADGFSSDRVELKIDVNGQQVGVILDKAEYEALCQFKPVQQKVLVGVLYEKKSFRELASILGKSEQYIGRIYKDIYEEFLGKLV